MANGPGSCHHRLAQRRPTPYLNAFLKVNFVGFLADSYATLSNAFFKSCSLLPRNSKMQAMLYLQRLFQCLKSE